MRNGCRRLRGWLFLPNANHVIALATVVTAAATIAYTVYAGRQWRTLSASSAQTERLINETHTLATNAGTQATNAADQVKKLGALVEATNKQAVATSGQLSVMQQQLEVTERPWVSLSVDRLSISPLNFGPKEGAATINYVMRNTGKSAALKANLRARLFIYSFDQLYTQITEQQAVLRKRMSAPNYPETTIFPGDTISDATPVTLYTNEISAGLKSRESGIARHPGFISMAVVICIDYRFPFSPKHHQTEYVFLIGVPGIGVMVDFKPEGTLSDIRLIYFRQSAN
jgi:hypothetical protein